MLVDYSDSEGENPKKEIPLPPPKIIPIEPPVQKKVKIAKPQRNIPAQFLKDNGMGIEGVENTKKGTFLPPQLQGRKKNISIE